VILVSELGRKAQAALERPA